MEANSINNMEKLERYYVYVDDILISTQYMIFMSLLVGYQNLIKIKESLENKKINELNLPDEDFYNEIIEKVKNEKYTKFKSLLEKSKNLIDKINDKLNISDPEKIAPVILTRDIREFITLNDLNNIDPDFPITLKTITSGVCDGIMSFPSQFEKIYRLVFRNKLEYMLYTNTLSPDNDFEEKDMVLDHCFIEDVFENIKKELNNDKRIYIITANKDAINNLYLSFKDDLIFLIPKNYEFLNFKDLKINNKIKCDVW